MESSARKFVLFDFDGVIADSLALSYEITRSFNPEVDEEKYRRLYEGNIYDSISKLPGWHPGHPEEYFKRFSPRMKDEVHLAQGMDDVIKKLAATYTLAIISSTPTAGIQWFLAKHGLTEYFADILGRDVHHSKVEKMRMVFEKHKTIAQHCVFITDTLGDMREAQAHEMGAIGTSWGVHPRETLEKGIPFRIVEHARELPDAVDDYFARATV